MAGFMGPHEASNQPRLHSGLRKGAPRLLVGWGGLLSDALTDGWRHDRPHRGLAPFPTAPSAVAPCGAPRLRKEPMIARRGGSFRSQAEPTRKSARPWARG